MWIVKWILLAFVVVIITWFAAQNGSTTTKVNFFSWEFEQVPLIIVMLESFAAGVVAWLIVSIFQMMSCRTRLRLYQQENKRLKSELESLRSSGSQQDEGEEGRQ